MPVFGLKKPLLIFSKIGSGLYDGLSTDCYELKVNALPAKFAPLLLLPPWVPAGFGLS